MIPSVNKLVRQIREALASGGANAPVESLAAEYARISAEAAQHLESCAIMIGKGSEYQALQLAETEPALLDLVAALSFAEAPEWAEFCHAQRLPVASKFDPRAVQALDHLYAKGITANHPLYKDYRAAVTSRDDVKALQIVRSIVRLNPDDANASAELTRWENKFFQRRLQSLRDALSHHDEPAVLTELGELERLAPPEKLDELPEVAQAKAVRRADERKAAIELSDRLIASLKEERTSGSWRMVGDLLARLDTLQAEHDFHLPPASAAVCAEMKRYYESERALASTAERFQRALSVAKDLAEDADVRLLGKQSLTLSETEALYFDLHRRWKEIEHFQQAVDEGARHRIGASMAALREELGRLRRRRRVKEIAAGLAALLLIGATAWWAFSAYQARDYEKRLTELRNAGQVEAVERMTTYLRSEQPGLATRPILRSKLDALEKWTRDQRANLKAAETVLAELEAMNSAGFETFDPVSAANQLATDTKLIAALPAGLQATPGSRLAVVRNQFETYLNEAREKLAARNDETLSSLESIAGTQLTYDQSREVISGALQKIEPQLKMLEALLDPPLTALALPEALQARVTALRTRYDLFQRELSILKEVRDALLQAADFETYRAALAGYKQSHLAQVAEVNSARKLLAAFPKPDDLLARLLIPGDPAAWASAKLDVSGVAMTPNSVLPGEIAKLLSLREDGFLSDLWEVTLVDYTHKGERREVYSHGDLKKDGPREIGDGLVTTSWSGAAFDPSLKGESIVFAPVKVTSTRSAGGISGTGEIAANRLSAVSQALARLELNRMTDASGEKFEKPLLRVFDALVREREASPIFKAFMMQQLALIMSYRPNAWGAQYCPSLKADLENLKQLCAGRALRSEDWLLDRKRMELLPVLAPFFHELESRDYFAEAQLNRDLVRSALKAGIHYGGYIDEDFHPHLLGEASAGMTVWSISASTGEPVKFHLPEKGGGVDERLARFSPVFFVPVDSGTLELAASRVAKGDARGKSKRTGIPLFEP